MNVLQQVKALGQQIWLDNLSRSLVASGQLARLLQQGVCGVTSNPAIFEKAFAGDALYREEIAALKQQNLTPKQRYEVLALADVQAACDVCLTEYRRSSGQSGFVSLEVEPDLADEAADTVIEAQRLYAAIARENVMIKVPATAAGLQALTELVAAGLHVNLTLLFSRKQALKAYQAYCEGLRRRKALGLPVSGIQVVASFFLSRIDSALDATLPLHLQGKTAIALAKTAYQDAQTFFGSVDFADLATEGAAPVRLLWASTGTKNPDYSDVLYVESLIGAQTINTVPDKTLAAFIDHGQVEATLKEDVALALEVLDEVGALGVDVDVLAARLQQDGLQQFAAAFEALLELLRN